MMMNYLFSLLVVSLIAVEAFYLPGVKPIDYQVGERVALKVNALTSVRTHLPYEYYHLPFCKPALGVQESKENLGELLTGNVIENSAYDIRMREPVECAVLCRKLYSKDEVKKFAEMIEDGYVVNWIMDNLPAAYRTFRNVDELYFQHGFPLGGVAIVQSATKKRAKNYFLNNHVEIIIDYHIPKALYGESVDTNYARIVKLVVEPFSVKHQSSGTWNTEDETKNSIKTCPTFSEVGKAVSKDHAAGMLLETDSEKVEVIWTYSVNWQSSEVKWASRWDVYLQGKENESQIHWFSIINSLLITGFLTGMVALIMIRALHKDLSRYNRVPTDEEKAQDREETGWKLIHGDVFRPPKYPLLFSVTVGTGIQVLYMTAITIVFAAFGFLSPANRGSLMIALVLLFMFMGIGAGYTSARTYKMFNGAHWQRCTLATALFYPMIIGSVLFVLNLFVWAEGAASAIPFGTMLGVLALWFLVSVPLTFLGAFYGYKRDVDKQPVQTQEIPRAIPPKSWYTSPILTIMLGGILPFGAVFVELFFILSSIWLDMYYYVFGFLLLVFAILIITSAEITIVLCYFQLCAEDYHWWWRSLLTSGSSAVFLFLYSAFYFSTRVPEGHNLVTAILYFGYMFILSLLFFLATAVVGYYACLWFVIKIYSSVKVD